MYACVCEDANTIAPSTRNDIIICVCLPECLLHSCTAILSNCNVVAICRVSVVSNRDEALKVRVVHLDSNTGEVITDLMKTQ